MESFETRLFQEELEDQIFPREGASERGEQPGARPPPGSRQQTLTLHSPSPPGQPQQAQPQPAPPPLIKPILPASPHRPRLRRRDYSIDEKTDALFNEFLRHDPRFDQPDSPLRSRHRSRVHLRKQWQKHKQYSDPGAGAGGGR